MAWEAFDRNRKGCWLESASPDLFLLSTNCPPGSLKRKGQKRIPGADLLPTCGGKFPCGYPKHPRPNTHTFLALIHDQKHYTTVCQTHYHHPLKSTYICAVSIHDLITQTRTLVHSSLISLSFSQRAQEEWRSSGQVGGCRSPTSRSPLSAPFSTKWMLLSVKMCRLRSIESFLLRFSERNSHRVPVRVHSWNRS